ncbi:hypothetical protein [Thermoflavifilum thermophilum]|uniref:Uncharacterized protein n=1 Tax=Thermoflavifilum thermophilum TaxID=1393122 RepID=A0A1I7NM12_9BACT|nr:hypothetical protein [Thermoflavifilum thermophilum]SFV35721.1 hypothetical protein SAMN05660895_2296 [Thermoflavifilum thermophilum]
MPSFIQPLQTDEEGRLMGGFSPAFAITATNPHCADTQMANNCQGGNCPQHCTPTHYTVDTTILHGKNVTNNCMQNCAKGCDSIRTHVGISVMPAHPVGH